MAKRVRVDFVTGQPPAVPEEIRRAVIFKHDGSMVIVGAAAQKTIEACCRELVEVMMSRDRTTAFCAMQYVLSALWCNGHEADTVVDAVDSWRKYSQGVEVGIRESFGELRYPKESE